MTNAKPTDAHADHQARTQRCRFIMPAVVLGLLGGHMLFILIAITLGTGDPSFAVVPDYYQKGVDYDERKALLTQSAALGWQAELLPSDQADAIGQRELFVQLRDASGMAVTGMDVRVNAYHLARASEPVAFECVEALPGQYVGIERLTKEGFWQFELSAVLDDQHFVADIRQFVTAAEGTP